MNTGTMAISARPVKNGKPTLSKETEKLIAQETKAAERLAAKVRAEKPVVKSEAPKAPVKATKIGPRPGHEADKPKAPAPVKVPPKAEPKTPVKKSADPKSGVQILLAAIRAAGPKGLTKDEILEKLKGKMPNANPTTMIPRTLSPYLTSKGLIEQKGDRYIAKGEKK